jgi:hypothetical protein
MKGLGLAGDSGEEFLAHLPFRRHLQTDLDSHVTSASHSTA